MSRQQGFWYPRASVEIIDMCLRNQLVQILQPRLVFGVDDNMIGIAGFYDLLHIHQAIKPSDLFHIPFLSQLHQLDKNFRRAY